MNKRLKDVLCCPKCRQELVYENEFIHCPECKGQVLVDNRLLDFGYMSPLLPLALAKRVQELTENAGESMKDIEPDWRIKFVLDHVKKKAQGSVCLEIGGADGPMTPSLEKLFDLVLTIDYSKNFLKRIEAKTKETICLFGDTHFLPLQDHTVDMVVCSEVLEHVTIPTQLLTEVRRVIKKGSFVILSVPNESTLRLNRRTKIAHLPAGDTHINFFTPETLEKLVFRVGFEVVDIRTILPPNSSLGALSRNITAFIRKGFYGSFILCTLRAMENPWLYWDSFQEKICK